MKLDAVKVKEIFLDCMYSEDRLKSSTKEELMKEAILVEGIVTNVGFDPEKIAKHKSEIIELLDELPDEFKHGVAGGYSFLKACEDKHGNHWGDHRSMEQLFMLGIACKRVNCILPRELWPALPGGVPYYEVFDKDVEEVETNENDKRVS